MIEQRLTAIDSADDPRIAEFRDIRERDLTGRGGRFIAEGTVVLRLLAEAHIASTDFIAEKVLLLRNRVAGLEAILARLPADVPVYVADAAVLDAVVGFHLHRGVLALGRRVPEGSIEGFIESLPSDAHVLVGCGISNHDNVGSMFRNAAAFGVNGVLLDGGSCDPLYRKSIRVSVGSVLTLPYRRQGTSLAVLEALSNRGFAIWGLSPRGEVPVGAIPADGRMALVVGTEGEGLPSEIMTRFRTARIPQAPGLDSLNVATATGVALYAVASAAGRI